MTTKAEAPLEVEGAASQVLQSFSRFCSALIRLAKLGSAFEQVSEEWIRNSSCRCANRNARR